MTERFRMAGAAAALILTLAACSEPTPGVARGEALFDTCAPCHGENGEGNQFVDSGILGRHGSFGTVPINWTEGAPVR